MGKCNRPWIRAWEKFTALRIGSRIALRGGHGNKYCSDNGGGVQCNRPWIKGWEKFLAHTVSGGARKVVHKKRVCHRAYRTAYRTAYRWAYSWAYKNVCHRTSCSVDVYKHCNYRGYRIHLTPGSYNMHALIRKGMKNDDLSSIRVNGRCVARLYQHWNFGGKVLTKSRSDSCFTNDRMYIPLSQLHQLVVHEVPEPKLVETASKEGAQAGWGGRRRRRRRRRRFTSWNDQVSSIRVSGSSSNRCRRVRYRKRIRKAYKKAYTKCRWVGVRVTARRRVRVTARRRAARR